MANQIFINDQDIVECRVVGDQTGQSVETMGKTIQESLEQLRRQRKSLLVLDDIRQMGKVQTQGRDAVVRLAKTLPYDRLAMLGNSGLLQLGANLLIRASGRGAKMRYFIDHGQAVDWLKKFARKP